MTHATAAAAARRAGRANGPATASAPVPPRPPAPAEIVFKADLFSHDDARAISRWVLRRANARLIVIDLSRAEDATLPAFAALIALRRRLLRDGRDLRLAGLRDRTHVVYQVNRLETILPKHAMN